MLRHLTCIYRGMFPHPNTTLHPWLLKVMPNPWYAIAHGEVVASGAGCSARIHMFGVSKRSSGSHA